MAQFSTAPVNDVVPKRKLRQPSQRSQIREQYRDALERALNEDQALVVELEGDDKPLTIRNRIKRAVTSLGADDVTVRRRGKRIVVYRGEQPSEV